MKKLSFFLMAMLFSVMSFAAEAKFDWSGITTTQSPTVANVYTEGDVTLTFEKASGSNIPAENKEGSIRMYKGTTLKIAVAGENNVITNVAFTCTSASYAATNLQYNGEALPSNEWALTTPAAEILLNAAANARFKSIVVTYGQVSADYIAAPAISGDVDFIESTEVSIAAGEGLKVYYTVDGNDPTNASAEYTAPFEVTATTTVKAIAYNGENASEVASQTFTKATEVTCAEAREIALKVSGNNVPTELTYVVKGYVTNIVGDWKSGKQSFWIADTKDGGEVFEAYYCFISKAVTLGDYVQLFGKLTKYNTTPEMADGQATILPEPAPEPVMFNVTVTAENGTVEGAGEYAENAEATLTATPAEGYEFVNWTVDGTEVSTENPYTFVVTANVALVANFKAVVIEEPLPEGVPTNAELWEAFKPYYNTYYSLARDLSHPVANVSTFANAKMQEIMTDAASEYKWLGDYVLGVAAAQGVNLPTDMAAANESAWRWAVHAFFNAAAGQHGAAGTDFTEAGKPQAWGPAYLAAQQPAEPTTETVYFINTKKWAAVTAHAWGAKLPDTAWPGLATVKEAEQIAGYDVYSFTANVGDYANVIFNNKGGGSQTPDLVWTAGKYYVIDMGWLTKEEAETKLAAPLPETWNIVGAAGLMGTDWNLNDAKNAMTLQADGTYLLEKKDITITAGSYEYKAAKDHGWTVAVPQDGNQTLKITTSGIYDVTFVLDVTAKKLTATATLKQAAVVIPTVVIAGDMNSWNQTKDKFTMAADSLTATFKTTLAVKNYGFKMIVGGAWHSDGKTVTRAANSTKFTGANSSTNSTLKADIAGEYLFTWEYATKTLTVTYPALPVKYNVTVTAENGTVEGAGEYEEGKTATLTATAAEGYEFVNWTVGDSIVSTENPYSFVVTADVALVANFKEVEPAIEWIEMPLEISNLTTMEMPVEGVTYLQLTGRDDMNDADVMLFLNNYTGEEKAYEVNAESSFMTFGGMELTVMDGSITKSVDPELGDVYAGIVHASVEEDGVAMYVAFDLKMYALPATVIELDGVEITVNEESAIAFFNATWEGSPLQVEVSGFEEVEFKEYPECWLSIGDDNVWVDAAAGPVAVIIEDGVAMLEGEFTSFATGKSYYVMLSGKLPVKEEPVVEPTYTENKLNPFAFGLESVLSEDASLLTVTYRLNNSNATSVDVVVYNGEEVVATVPGTTTIGKNTVEVATADLPAGVQLTWGVVVKGTSVEAPTQEEKMYSMYCPHGLAIDTDPESEYFGRILVADAMNIVKDKAGYLGSGIGAGLHVFNPSFTTDSTVYTGGNDFTRILASNGYQPWRVKISEDGRIFVSSLDLNGVAVWEVSKDLQTWTPVIAGTNDATDYNIYDAEGNFIAGPNCSMDVIGSGEDLKLLLYSTNNKGIAFNQSGYRLDEYALGTATTWTGTPTNIINGGAYGVVHTNVEFIYDGEGGYWFGGSRAGNAGQPNLVHINAAGEQDYYTEDAGLYGGDGVLVHNGMLFKGKARTSGTVGNFGVWTIGKDADGKVTLTEKWTVAANGIGRNLNEFAVDYAENLYIVGNSGEKIIAYALPYSGEVTTPAAAKFAFQLEGAVVEPVELVGVVKRAIQYYDATIVLTHEADGTAHIYNVVDGVVAEVSQEGVIAVDPENAGDYLAISDIALTEDGKLVATNYMQTQSGDDYVDAGYKRGETRVYLWNDLAGDPAILFTSKMSSNWFRSKQGLTMAVKGTSDNMEIFMTGIHATKAWARTSSYRVIDGVYTEPDVNNNDYYHFYDVADAVALETTVGTQYELTASPLGAMNWILDAELINPVEIVEPETNNVEISTCVALTQDLGKKYQGVSVVTVGEQHLMVAPYATAEGLLAGVKVLDITAGLDAATEVATADLDAAVEATAAATAVAVAENVLTITLVADATIYTLNVELESEPNYMVIEDNITNLVIDLENMAIIGGPSTMWQVDVFLGLGQDNGDGTFTLTEESSVAIMGFDARFIDGYVYDIDLNAPAAKAVLHVEDSGFLYEIKLNMTNTPQEAIVVVVEDATVQIDTIPLFGDMVDYALKMTANWTYAEDGVTYPVLVEVPVYYPEATEPSEMTCTVTIGGQGVDDPWLGFGEGTLTITTVDGVVTAKGIVANPYTGVAFDVTVSGKLPVVEPEATWTVAGAPASIFGTEWDPSNTANDMVKQEDGTYKWEKTDLTLAASNIQFKVAKNHAWDEAYPSANYDLAIAEAGIYTITITFNPATQEVVGTATKTGDAVVIPTIAIAGDMNGWNTTDNEFVKSDDGLTASLTLSLEAKDYGFKIIVAGGWTSDGATVTRENNTVVFTGANAGNSTLVADVAGDYTFTWTYATSTLVVTYPVASSVDNVQVNATAVKVIKNGQLIIIKNGKEYNVQGAQL